MVCVPLIAGYGWTLNSHVVRTSTLKAGKRHILLTFVTKHIAVPLVLQFWIGFTNQVNFTVSSRLVA